jgi:hypothetical protein
LSALGFVLLLGFVALCAKLNTFGEAGLCSLVTVNAGRVPVLLPVEGSAFVVPGGTLIMLPGGSGVPVLLPVVIPPVENTLVPMVFTVTVRCFVHVAPRQLTP